jgi:hypothetical protein
MVVRFQRHVSLPQNEPTELGGAPNNGTNRENASLQNAFRHTFLQAVITSAFDRHIATEVGLAHEHRPQLAERNPGVFVNPSNPSAALFEADTSADMLNNEIGRRIAEENPNVSYKELAILILEEFRNNGLYVGRATQPGVFMVTRVRLTEDQFTAARDRALALDNVGRSREERLRDMLLSR